MRKAAAHLAAPIKRLLALSYRFTRARSTFAEAIDGSAPACVDARADLPARGVGLLHRLNAPRRQPGFFARALTHRAANRKDACVTII
jgi:hypothetical protein